MKRFQKLLLMLVVAFGSVVSASAQIYVTVRPARPVYVRPAPPGPGYVWIDEDWDGVDDRYEWHGGYWAAPPTPGYYYHPGYWRRTDRGHVWIRGRWDARPYRARTHHPGHKHKPGHPHQRK